MSIGTVLKTTERLIVKNAPAILTVVGVAGTIATAVLSARAHREAFLTVENARWDSPNREFGEKTELTKTQKVELTWQLYVLPTAVGVGTCASIIMAQKINAKRMAYMLAGYAALERRHNEYLVKAKDALGLDVDKKIRQELAQEQLDNTVVPTATKLVLMDGNDCLVQEAWTGRTFRSSKDVLERLERNINTRLSRGDDVSLSDVYERLGLPKTSESDNFGWSGDSVTGRHVQILISPVEHQGTPALGFDYDPMPSLSHPF